LPKLLELSDDIAAEAWIAEELPDSSVLVISGGDSPRQVGTTPSATTEPAKAAFEE
jgi:hypothetical protein